MTDVSPDLKAAIERARNREQWVRYDSLVIGRGAKGATPTWYEDMAEFAQASELTWFTSTRDRQCGAAYCNMGNGGQENFGQVIYQSGIEFITPPGFLNQESVSIDSSLLQTLFEEELPRRMSFSFKMQDTDQVLEVPGIHVPAMVGTSGRNVSAAGALQSVAGGTGEPNFRGGWTWPDPVIVPANRKIGVTAKIDRPISALLQALVGVPGVKTIPIAITSPGGGTELRQVTYPNWYAIRIWHRGPRFVQFRGAYAASGTT